MNKTAYVSLYNKIKVTEVTTKNKRPKITPKSLKRYPDPFNLFILGIYQKRLKKN